MDDKQTMNLVRDHLSARDAPTTDVPWMDAGSKLNKPYMLDKFEKVSRHVSSTGPTCGAGIHAKPVLILIPLLPVSSHHTSFSIVLLHHT